MTAFAQATSLPHGECPCCRQRPPPFLVQLSTDQIYAGKRGEEDSAEIASLWREEETEKKVARDPNAPPPQDGDEVSLHLHDFEPESPAVKPVNTYARQKVEAETLISRRYPRSVCLRSSVMYGRLPRDRSAVKGMRFLQFCDEALKRSASSSAASGNETTSASFFEDEFRSFVAVTDVAKAVAACVREWGHGDGMTRDSCALLPLAINVGGPERLSRAEFARLVAEARGLDPDLVKAVPSASAARSVPSPRDISMSVDRLEKLLKLKPLSVREALGDMPPEDEEEERRASGSGAGTSR